MSHQINKQGEALWGPKIAVTPNAAPRTFSAVLVISPVPAGTAAKDVHTAVQILLSPEAQPVSTSGENYGKAFLNFATQEAADTALALFAGKSLFGVPLTVKVKSQVTAVGALGQGVKQRAATEYGGVRLHAGDGATVTSAASSSRASDAASVTSAGSSKPAYAEDVTYMTGSAVSGKALTPFNLVISPVPAGLPAGEVLAAVSSLLVAAVAPYNSSGENFGKAYLNFKTEEAAAAVEAELEGKQLWGSSIFVRRKGAPSGPAAPAAMPGRSSVGNFNGSHSKAPAKEQSARKERAAGGGNAPMSAPAKAGVSRAGSGDEQEDTSSVVSSGSDAAMSQASDSSTASRAPDCSLVVKPVASNIASREVRTALLPSLQAAGLRLLSCSGEISGRAFLNFCSAQEAGQAMEALLRLDLAPSWAGGRKLRVEVQRPARRGPAGSFEGSELLSCAESAASMDEGRAVSLGMDVPLSQRVVVMGPAISGSVSMESFLEELQRTFGVLPAHSSAGRRQVQLVFRSQAAAQAAARALNGAVVQSCRCTAFVASSTSAIMGGPAARVWAQLVDRAGPALAGSAMLQAALAEWQRVSSEALFSHLQDMRTVQTRLRGDEFPSLYRQSFRRMLAVPAGPLLLPEGGKGMAKAGAAKAADAATAGGAATELGPSRGNPDDFTAEEAAEAEAAAIAATTYWLQGMAPEEELAVVKLTAEQASLHALPRGWVGAPVQLQYSALSGVEALWQEVQRGSDGVLLKWLAGRVQPSQGIFVLLSADGQRPLFSARPLGPWQLQEGCSGGRFLGVQPSSWIGHEGSMCFLKSTWRWWLAGSREGTAAVREVFAFDAAQSTCRLREDGSLQVADGSSCTAAGAVAEHVVVVRDLACSTQLRLDSKLLSLRKGMDEDWVAISEGTWTLAPGGPPSALGGYTARWDSRPGQDTVAHFAVKSSWGGGGWWVDGTGAFDGLLAVLKEPAQEEEQGQGAAAASSSSGAAASVSQQQKKARGIVELLDASEAVQVELSVGEARLPVGWLCGSSRSLLGDWGRHCAPFAHWVSDVVTEEEREARKPVAAQLEQLQRQEDEYSSTTGVLLERVRRADSLGAAKALVGNLGRETARLQAKLPAYAHRSTLVAAVRRHQVICLLGATGSGKSTQALPFLVDAAILGGSAGGTIVCTQPRKVAAVSLATHVASEWGSELGLDVGYQVGGGGRKLMKGCRMIYKTDRTVLGELVADPMLRKYDAVVVDEAHERSLDTDLLLAFLKQLLPARPDFRVIIASATIQPDLFLRYFGLPQAEWATAVVRIPGRTFPVEHEWQPRPADLVRRVVQHCVSKAREVHTSAEPGDILVFLPTPEEVKEACKLMAGQRGLVDSALVLPLHGKLLPEEQQAVFAPAPPGRRKIIFSTNVAETSVTINGVVHVIDSGLAKTAVYDAVRNVSTMLVGPITRSSVTQRAGRAGRTQPGVAYHLYDESDLAGMGETQTAEILRVELQSAVLRLAELGICDPASFDFMEHPGKDRIAAAVKHLQTMDFLEGGSGRLTDEGRKAASLGIDPRICRMLLTASKLNVLHRALPAAGILCAPGQLFWRPEAVAEQAAALAAQAALVDPLGDVVSAANIFAAWQAVPERGRRDWCKANFIVPKTLQTAEDFVGSIVRAMDSSKPAGIFAKELSQLASLVVGEAISRRGKDAGSGGKAASVADDPARAAAAAGGAGREDNDELGRAAVNGTVSAAADCSNATAGAAAAGGVVRSRSAEMEPSKFVEVPAAAVGAGNDPSKGETSAGDNDPSKGRTASGGAGRSKHSRDAGSAILGSKREESGGSGVSERALLASIARACHAASGDRDSSMALCRSFFTAYSDNVCAPNGPEKAGLLLVKDISGATAGGCDGWDVEDDEGEEQLEEDDLSGACGICGFSLADGGRVQTLSSCGHGFHTACIQPYVSGGTGCTSCRHAGGAAGDPSRAGGGADDPSRAVSGTGGDPSRAVSGAGGESASSVSGRSGRSRAHGASGEAAGGAGAAASGMRSVFVHPSSSLMAGAHRQATGSDSLSCGSTAGRGRGTAPSVSGTGKGIIGSAGSGLWLAYQSLVVTKRPFIRGCSAVDPRWPEVAAAGIDPSVVERRVKSAMRSVVLEAGDWALLPVFLGKGGAALRHLEATLDAVIVLPQNQQQQRGSKSQPQQRLKPGSSGGSSSGPETGPMVLEVYGTPDSVDQAARVVAMRFELLRAEAAARQAAWEERRRRAEEERTRRHEEYLERVAEREKRERERRERDEARRRRERERESEAWRWASRARDRPYCGTPGRTPPRARY